MLNKVKIFFFYTSSIIFIIFFSSCKDDTVSVILPEPDYSPIWPQAGYNAQNTGNPYAPKVKCNPVNLGQVDWYYEFPSGSYSDGAEFCVDSKSNIYFYSQNDNQMKIYKFRHEGSVIWAVNVYGVHNFASISLNSDESKIYFHNNAEFCCYDSSGNRIWAIDPGGAMCKPAVGSDGTIYTSINNAVCAINPDGTIKWKSTVQFNSYTTYHFAIDKDNNLYVGGRSITKLDKNGNVFWNYLPNSQDFITEGVVIDGYGNLYFENYRQNANENDLFSLTKDGVFRWSAITYCRQMVPAITSKNLIYIVSSDYARAFDTSGNLIWEYKDSTLTGGDPIIDDEDNLYCIGEDWNGRFVANSINNKGELRWSASISVLSGLLPRPALMPMGKMLISPKRGFKIACVK
ncbi:MAG: hypothetical protein EHM58_11050 [Ignavibacteriae bacterium]|nr:MAG: hypothetical protein EHM58_11050 [Ignavibacteriota bacterium]